MIRNLIQRSNGLNHNSVYKVIFLSVVQFYLISDCHDPIKVGYIFENVVATTYGRRVGVSSCDTGYTGTPDVTYIECLANGVWSAVSGCMVGSKYTQNYA